MVGRRRISKKGGFEPGTIALGVLSAVTGISGYGANIMNKDQQKMIDEKVAAEVSSIKGSVDELNTIKESLRTETSEKEQLKTEVETLKNAIEQLKKEKASKEGQLKSVQVDEYAFRSASRAHLIKAFELVGEQLPKSPETDAAIKAFIAKTSSMLSRRGTLNEVVLELTRTTGKTPDEVREVIQEALRKAPEEVKKDAASSSDAKQQAAETMKEDLKKEQETTPVPEPEAIPEPSPMPQPETEEAEPEAEARPEQTDEKEMRDDECKNVLEGLEIKSRRDFLKWSKTNHPDKGGDTATYQRVNECVLRIYPQGGLRKKKLRTRRGGKQNVRRSRNRKNRSNRAN
jgi:hypothetical protein